MSTQPLANDIQSLIVAKTLPSHRYVALILSIALVLVCLAAFPYTAVKGPNEPAVSAIFTILTIFAGLMTAFLLFGQFLATRLPSLAILSGVYLYVGLINVPYLLTTPYIFAPHGFFGAGAHAPSWLWIFCQIGYSAGILLYVMIDRRDNLQRISRAASRNIHLLILAAIPLLVLLLAWMTINPYVLPDIVNPNPPPVLEPPVSLLVFSLNGLLCICSLILLSNRNVLHLWLRISMLASFLTTPLSLYAGKRYSVGWYVAHADGLMTALIVLCALLYEVHGIYRRLALQNDELIRHNHIQRDFISVIGHEFRTALTGILGFSGLMREGNLDDRDAQECADDIYNDAARLLRLINDLLDLERMKVGGMKMDWQQVEINSLIEEIVNRSGFASYKDRWRLDLDPSAPPIWADRDKLTQVMTNLMSNALKYSPEGSTIVIGSRREGDKVHLFVQDYGIGIAPEKQALIFERYVRVESGSSRYIGGTGLGLAIVRQIVEMHRGSIWVESTMGVGSIFHIVLPAQFHPA